MNTVPATQALLYVTEEYDVQVFDYPSGTQVGTLTGFSLPEGECADASGNVYVTDFGYAAVFEYARGGTIPTKVLSDPGQQPDDCAVDNAAQRVAVVNTSADNGARGSISTYDYGGTSPSHVYSDPKIRYMNAAGYDGAGRLYVDGFMSGQTIFAEMASNGHFINYPIKGATIGAPGGVKVSPNGKFIAVADYQPPSNQPAVIYHLKRNGQVLGKTTFSNCLGCGIEFFSFNSGNVITINNTATAVIVYPFPAGGAPVATFGTLHMGLGVTVSQ